VRDQAHEDDLVAVRRCSHARGAMDVETDVASRRYERLNTNVTVPLGRSSRTWS
jgi:hypothetical protein